MPSSHRRRATRMPLRLFVNEFHGQENGRSMAVNLSEQGVYVERLAGQVIPEKEVSLEFELPDTGEHIAVRGAIRHTRHDRYFQGSGIEFVEIDEAQRQIIDRFVSTYRLRELRRLRATIARNRRN